MANVVEMDYYSSFKKQLEAEGIGYVARQIDYTFLSVDCLRFVAELHRHFESERADLLDARVKQTSLVVAGVSLSLPADSESIRRDLSWRATAAVPPALADRTVDIVCLDMSSEDALISCMTSGANGVQVDFDDGFQCDWQSVRVAHSNLKSVVEQRTASCKDDAVLLVRPRSLNLSEFHVLVDGTPMSGALFDFGVHMFNSGRLLFEHGRGPYFYIPKLESRYEALWWSKVLAFTEQHLGLPHASIKVIVLIENVQAAFQMTEIVYYLKDYIVALNTGRWDYIFSVVKMTVANAECNAFPERSQLGFNQEFLLAYYKLLVAVSHQRGIAATGGMAALYPVGGASELSALEKENVYKGKVVEAELGFDGALVAHRSAVDACRKAFTNRLKDTSSLIKGDIWQYHNSLLAIPKGEITLAGVNSSISVLVQYILKWVQGVGAVPINGVVEDLATAEINRALLWRWIRSHIKTKEGNPITFRYVLQRAREIASENNENQSDFDKLEKIISILLHSNSFIDFMPTVMYPFVATIQLEAHL